MKAYNFYKILNWAQILSFSATMGYLFEGKIDNAIIACLLLIAFIMAKINLLLEAKFETDPEFWDVVIKRKDSRN